jgi:hypothetical protein
MAERTSSWRKALTLAALGGSALALLTASAWQALGPGPWSSGGPGWRYGQGADAILSPFLLVAGLVLGLLTLATAVAGWEEDTPARGEVERLLDAKRQGALTAAGGEIRFTAFLAAGTPPPGEEPGPAGGPYLDRLVRRKTLRAWLPPQA